jgi:hypothetical protein
MERHEVEGKRRRGEKEPDGEHVDAEFQGAEHQARDRVFARPDTLVETEQEPESIVAARGGHGPDASGATAATEE